MRKQIGTAQITRVRVYPLDPMAEGRHGVFTEVVVQPGTYPVYQDGLSRYWQMRGLINHRAYRMGDGMFAMSSSGDVLSEDDVLFYSRRYGPDEWKDLTEEFARQPDPAVILRCEETP